MRGTLLEVRESEDYLRICNDRINDNEGSSNDDGNANKSNDWRLTGGTRTEIECEIYLNTCNDSFAADKKSNDDN